MKQKLTDKKEKNDKKALKQLNYNRQKEQLNSASLKSYYTKTAQHIIDLSFQIEEVSKQLLEYRQKRKGAKKDITELLQRKERVMREFKTIPKL